LNDKAIESYVVNCYVLFLVILRVIIIVDRRSEEELFGGDINGFGAKEVLVEGSLDEDLDVVVVDELDGAFLNESSDDVIESGVADLGGVSVWRGSGVDGGA
jgi:hypothetical protein